LKKGIVAMVLAGGQGTRLGVLTENIAKPAVPFGGKYRIIDFSLSNCVNSGIFKVGVLTQFKPHMLNAHIGIGRPWDLDRQGGGVTILQPYSYEAGNIWFRGTANAIYENLDFVEKMDPKFLVVLSGDHIYAMDYMDMINFHIAKHATATVACMNVPLSETQRFGIMVTDLERKVVEFQEKPKIAKSTLASLGIYIFNWDFLKERLHEDAGDEKSAHDFGIDIIPKIVEEKGPIFAYEFEGYWRDVGTIHSYWETNLELTQPIPQLNLYNPSWRFYTRTKEMPPAVFGSEAVVVNSMVSEGSEINGVLDHSILFQGVKVAKGSVIKNSILLTGTVVEEGVEIYNSIVAENVVIRREAKIGSGTFSQSLEDTKVYNSDITVVGYSSIIPDKAHIGRNCVIHSDVNEDDFTSLSVPSGGFVVKKEQK